MRKTTCLSCGKDIEVFNNGKSRCPNETCGLGWAIVAVWERLEQRGDHMCYKRTMQRKGDVAYISAYAPRGDGTSKRKDYRVLDIIRLSWGEPLPPPSHKYERLCEESECVNPDHHRLAILPNKSPVLTISAMLPAEPILRAVLRWQMVHQKDFVNHPDYQRIPERLQRMILRAGRAGVLTVTEADEICCDLLGLHPANIYGDLFYEAA